MWATVAKLLGGPLIKRGFDWLMGKQEERKHERALRAEWELEALRKSSALLRTVAFVTVWGPIYHAYFLVMWNTPMNTPEDVANGISQVFNAFPVWWTGAAVTILLAIWGIKERDSGLVARAVADKEKERGKAAHALQERKRDEVRRTAGPHKRSP